MTTTSSQPCTLSTHILDTSLGHPAQGIQVTLEFESGSQWTHVSKGTTNADGRIAFPDPLPAGQYRLHFQIAEYFKKNGITPFFTLAPVVFQITDTSRKYHVPLLLNPYGYSTYRGS